MFYIVSHFFFVAMYRICYHRTDWEGVCWFMAKDCKCCQRDCLRTVFWFGVELHLHSVVAFSWFWFSTYNQTVVEDFFRRNISNHKTWIINDFVCWFSEFDMLRFDWRMICLILSFYKMLFESCLFIYYEFG